MQYTKPMIELVYEIRRFGPSELKPDIKLANPELFNVLQDYYHQSANAVSKALIKELFHLAGEPWPTRLSTAQNAKTSQTVRVYRGQVQLEDKAPTAEKSAEHRKKRVYRGQIIG